METNNEERIYVLGDSVGYVSLIDSMGSDIDIVRAARISYDAEPRGAEDEKLLRYLYKNKHTSPFEMVEFKFDVVLPIFVARQWIRHRTGSFNEVSARYTALPDQFYIPKPDVIGVQSKVSKQARTLNNHPVSSMVREFQISALKRHCKDSYTMYKALLDCEWPRELARMALPLNIYTHWIWKVDLHNLLHFIRLREHPHAQWEIQQYAAAIKNLIAQVVPITIKIYDEFEAE